MLFFVTKSDTKVMPTNHYEAIYFDTTCIYWSN